MHSFFSKDSVLSRLLQDRGGNFAILTGLLAVPLLLAAGLAIDYSMAAVERTNMQEIADGAALAGGKIFDGSNFSDAQAAAQSFIQGYGDKLPKDVAFNITSSGQTIQVTMNGSVATTLMQIGNINASQIGVAAAATSPLKPEKITFTPTKAQGWYYKKVSIRVVREGSPDEVVLGTVTYQPTTHNDSGQGTMTVSPSNTIDLGKYTKLVLQMDIKNDGCGIGYHATISGSDVKCNTSTAAVDKTYNLTLRTDNPQTTNYLFVDGVQLPQGVTQPLEAFLGCSKTQSHAWEDGGGWERQDFFYTVTSQCTPDGQYVRLTQ
jgi:Flp pilus assembly protein TadG